MIITKETDYALRILRVLLDGEKHSVAEMSEVDGTLQGRMRTGKAFRNVRAKTGTVTGISFVLANAL